MPNEESEAAVQEAKEKADLAARREQLEEAEERAKVLNVTMVIFYKDAVAVRQG